MPVSIGNASSATLTSQVNYAGLFAQGVGTAVAAGQVPASAAPTLIGSATGLESDANISVATIQCLGTGNAAILWQATPQTRIRRGVSLEDKIQRIAGTANFTNPTSVGTLPPALAPVGAAIVNGVNSALYSGDITLDLRLPDTANISIFHALNDKWDLMADVQYTGWSTLQQLQVVRSTGVVLSTTPENFRNTWRASVGAIYRFSDNWLVRGGVAYDQSPVRDAERTPRLPDNDRTWLTM